MDEEEMISQIKDLISDRKSFITDDEETSEIFKKDVAALEMILDKYNMLKESNLVEKISGLETENQKLWERHNEEFNQISKAIEYVKSNEFIGKIRLSSENKQSINNLLNMLQGSDK